MIWFVSYYPRQYACQTYICALNDSEMVLEIFVFIEVVKQVSNLVCVFVAELSCLTKKPRNFTNVTFKYFKKL